MFKKISTSKKLLSNFRGRKYSDSGKNIKILGIETSCDDTGIAIVDSNGKILGEALHSQQQIHTR